MSNSTPDTSTIELTANEFAKGWLHRRMLVQIRTDRFTPLGPSYAQEVTVIEISPSANFVKLRDDNGRRFWVQTGALVVYETLAVKMRHSPEGEASRADREGHTP